MDVSSAGGGFIAHPPPLLDGYAKARALSITFAAAIMLDIWAGVSVTWWISVGEGLGDVRPSLLYVFPMTYWFVRVIIEWAASHPSTRKSKPARADLAMTVLIICSAAGSLAYSHWEVIAGAAPREVFVLRDYFWTSATLFVVGLVLGVVWTQALVGLFLIRSKSEAEAWGLPRVPVAVRSMWASALGSIAFLLFLSVLSLAFVPELRRIWLGVLLAPAIITAAGTGLSFLSATVRMPDGSVVRRSSRLGWLKEIFSRHDAAYQVGGWDSRAVHVASPLCNAARDGSLEGIIDAMKAGADPNCQCYLGWTPLMISVANGHSLVARHLLAAGADPDRINLMGRTAMMFAARYGRRDLVDLLLVRGADPNKRLVFEESAIEAAAMNGHKEVVELLLEHGAEPVPAKWHRHKVSEAVRAAGHIEIAAMLAKAEQSRGTGSTCVVEGAVVQTIRKREERSAQASS